MGPSLPAQTSLGPSCRVGGCSYGHFGRTSKPQGLPAFLGGQWIDSNSHSETMFGCDNVEKRKQVETASVR